MICSQIEEFAFGLMPVPGSPRFFSDLSGGQFGSGPAFLNFPFVGQGGFVNNFLALGKGQPTLEVPNLSPLLNPQPSDRGGESLTIPSRQPGGEGDRFTEENTRLPGPQIPPIPPPPPPERAPLIRAQDCKECQPWMKLKLRLQKDIQTETQQGQQQQQREIQTELDKFEKLETQHRTERDIQEELRTKYGLLETINSQIANLEQQQEEQQIRIDRQNLPPPGQPPPLIVPPSQGQPVAQPGHDLFHQGEPPPTLPKPENPVIFCVSCASQNDALRFLNGEPSQCSVMPGGDMQMAQPLGPPPIIDGAPEGPGAFFLDWLRDTLPNVRNAIEAAEVVSLLSGQPEAGAAAAVLCAAFPKQCAEIRAAAGL